MGKATCLVFALERNSLFILLTFTLFLFYSTPEGDTFSIFQIPRLFTLQTFLKRDRNGKRVSTCKMCKNKIAIQIFLPQNLSVISMPFSLSVNFPMCMPIWQPSDYGQFTIIDLKSNLALWIRIYHSGSDLSERKRKSTE